MATGVLQRGSLCMSHAMINGLVYYSHFFVNKIPFIDLRCYGNGFELLATLTDSLDYGASLCARTKRVGRILYIATCKASINGRVWHVSMCGRGCFSCLLAQYSDEL